MNPRDDVPKSPKNKKKKGDLNPFVDTGFIIGGDVSAVVSEIPKYIGMWIGAGWNFENAIVCFVTALDFIRRALAKDCANRTELIGKATMLIFAGSVLSLFTYQKYHIPLPAIMGGVTALGAPAFAVVAFLATVMAAIDYHQAKKRLSFEGWLNDSMRRLKHLDDKVQEIEAKNITIENKKTIEKNNEIKTEIERKRKKLIKNIELRCRVFHDIGESNKAADSTELEKSEEKRRSNREVIIRTIINKYPSISSVVVDGGDQQPLLSRERCVEKSTPNDRYKNAKLQVNCEKAAEDAKIKLGLCILVFIGATLMALALIPGCQPLAIAGFALVTIGSLGLAWQNREKIKHKLQSVRHRVKSISDSAVSFFKSKLTREETDLPVPNPSLGKN